MSESARPGVAAAPYPVEAGTKFRVRAEYIRDEFDNVNYSTVSAWRYFTYTKQFTSGGRDRPAGRRRPAGISTKDSLYEAIARHTATRIVGRAVEAVRPPSVAARLGGGQRQWQRLARRPVRSSRIPRSTIAAASPSRAATRKPLLSPPIVAVHLPQQRQPDRVVEVPVIAPACNRRRCDLGRRPCLPRCRCDPGSMPDGPASRYHPKH